MGEQYKKRRRRAVPGRKEDGSQLQMGRLAAAAALFLVCLVGRVCFPAQTEDYRAQLEQLLTGNTDIRAAFLQLGERLEEGEKTLDAVEDWCTAVFAPEEVTADEDTDTFPGEQSP